MPKNGILEAQLLLDSRSMLGEGPVWDWRRQVLFWVDIEGKMLCRFDPSNGQKAQWAFEEMIGAAVPTEKGGLLIALESGLATFSPESETLTKHGVLEDTDPNMRYNDGKVGPAGDFWIGSMHKEIEPDAGSLYRVGPQFEVEEKVKNTSISNGMAWSSDTKTFYYSDTHTYTIWRFDCEVTTGKISGRREAFTVPKDYGGADGMCIDAKDRLWIAHWGGHCVRCWQPETGEVLQEIKVDAPQVTSCCFGGPDLDTLFITTARSGMSEDDLEKHPESGGLFVCRPGATGTPITYFADKPSVPR